MRARLKVSRAGVELIKSFEGLRPSAVRLPDGRWTLGYGHTLSAREGAQVTADDAEALLRFDLLPIVEAVSTLVTVSLNQNQFDALVSFCFNIGVENFTTSLVLKRLNEGRMADAALAMDSWRSAEYNGETYVLAPLIRRRAAEKSLFLTPNDQTTSVSAPVARPVEAVAEPLPVSMPEPDAARLAAAAAEAAAMEKQRAEAEQTKLEQAKLELARIEEVRLEEARLEEVKRLEEEAQAQAEANRLLEEAEKAEALRQEALRQAEALAVARAAAEAARLAEDKRLAEEKQLAEEKRLAEEAAQKLAAEALAAQAQMVPPEPQVSAPPLDEEAEKARKAEAAAALMRLYSPYGVGPRGSLAAPQKPMVPTAPLSMPMPVAPKPQPAPELTPEPEPARPLIHNFPPRATASTMPAPVIAVMTPNGASAARAGFEPQPEAEPHIEPETQPVLSPIVEPESESGPVPASAPVSATASALHWREQLQRPLPQDYQPQAYVPAHETPAYEAPQPVASAFAESYEETSEDWMLEGGRIALSSEEMEEEGIGWWKMIVSTLSWILLSCFGLACLGVASAAWWMGRNDPTVARLGHIQSYTTVSIITAIAGILFVSVSVWLIMKRLGGLKD